MVGTVRGKVEPLPGWGAPHPAIAARVAPSTIVSHSLYLLKTGEEVIRRPGSHFDENHLFVAQVQGVANSGEGGRVGLGTSKNHPFLVS